MNDPGHGEHTSFARDVPQRARSFDLLAEQMRDGLWITSADNGEVRYLNPAFELIMGVPRQEFLHDARRLYERVHPEDREQARRFWSETVKGAETTVEFRIVRPGGEVRWVRTRAFPYDDGSGEALFAGIFEDISERRLARTALDESEKRFRNLVETTADWVWEVDAQGRYIYASPQVERVLGHRPDEVLGKTPFDFMPDEESERIGRAFRAIAAEKRPFAMLENVNRHRNGQLVVLETSGVPVLDAEGNLRGYRGIDRDITERKERERRRLEAEAAQRSALVREVHHRIKNSLQGVTGMLRRFAAGRPDLAPMLAEVAGQVHSVAVIHGLQGQTPMGRVTLCELARSIAANVESLLQARIDVDIALPGGPCAVLAETEAVPIALVLNELVFNAVKHASPGPAVRVTVDTDGAACCAEVRIANPGRLPPEFRAGAPTAKGAGLQLIASLLPPDGPNLLWREREGRVEAVLSLKVPTISLAVAERADAATPAWVLPRRPPLEIQA